MGDPSNNHELLLDHYTTFGLHYLKLLLIVQQNLTG